MRRALFSPFSAGTTDTSKSNYHTQYTYFQPHFPISSHNRFLLKTLRKLVFKGPYLFRFVGIETGRSQNVFFGKFQNGKKRLYVFFHNDSSLFRKTRLAGVMIEIQRLQRIDQHFILRTVFENDVCIA